MSKKTLLLVIFLVFSVALVMAAVDKKAGEESLKCPVSGKEFKKSDASPKYEYEGKTTREKHTTSVVQDVKKSLRKILRSIPRRMNMQAMTMMRNTLMPQNMHMLRSTHMLSMRTMTIKHMQRKTERPSTLSVG
jgi:hypothetical protein